MTDFGIDPRGDLSGVDPEERDAHVMAIAQILNQDKDDTEIAEDLRAHVREHLNPYPELWIAVNDELAVSDVISKAQLKAYLSLNLTADYDPSPWCQYCGAMKRADCHCGPIADNH